MSEELVRLKNCIRTGFENARSYQRTDKPDGGNMMKLSAENEMTTTITTGASKRA